ncbi:MAG: DotD/TraH family lipoprotein [Gammaproteobacteria bacterium]|nr:DotD/TraH family lipoprotein [Gammaproteobacteria bacterium]
MKLMHWRFRIPLLLIILYVLLPGCATKPEPTASEQVRQRIEEAEDKDTQLVLEQIAQASKNIEQAVGILSQTNNAMATQLLTEDQKVKALARANQVPKGFEKKGSMQWYGPLNQLVERLAMMADYKVKIVGSPVQPLMINLDMKDVPIVEMYRSIQYQVGSRAVISANNRLLRVTYPSKGL